MFAIRMQITHLECLLASRSPAPSPRSPGGRDLRGAPPDGEGAVLRIGTDDGVRKASRSRRGAERADPRGHRRPRAARRAARRRPAAARVAVAPPVGARPHRGAPALHPRPRRHRAVGPRRRVAGPADLAAPRRLPAVDPGLRVDRRRSRRSRSTSTSPRSASSSATRRSSCTPGATREPTRGCAWRCASTSAPTSR